MIDGQGGKMGKMLVEELRKVLPLFDIYAFGTNSIATSTMLKAGATFGATGENPIIHNCIDANIILGSIGIIVANSYLGEITPTMATSISASKATKILIPVNRCNIAVAGTREMSFSEYAKLAVLQIEKIINEEKR